MTRLTSLANVRAFLALPTVNQDALINRLIVRESAAIERYCSRVFGFTSLVDQRLNGTGTTRVTLPVRPVLGVTSVSDGGTNVPVSNTPTTLGYLADKSGITLTGGGRFAQAIGNLVVSWDAGYRATGTATLPAGPGDENAPVTVAIEPCNDLTFNTSQERDVGFAMQALAVSYANGVAFAEVSATPDAAGTFRLADGIVTFFLGTFGNMTANVPAVPGDANAPVVLTIGYCPADVEQACIEMVGLDLKQRDNLGISSKTLAGESITYEKQSMSASVKGMLGPYKSVTPA